MGNQPHGIKCNKCGVVKPLAIDFERRPDSKFGYRRTCKECRRDAKNATNNRYYHRHKERILPAWRDWRRENRERVALWCLRYYLKNRDKKLAYNRAYYQKHRERLIRESVERRRRRVGHELDYGWSKGLAHSRIELEAQRQHWGQHVGGGVRSRPVRAVDTSGAGNTARHSWRVTLNQFPAMYWKQLEPNLRRWENEFNPKRHAFAIRPDSDSRASASGRAIRIGYCKSAKKPE